VAFLFLSQDDLLRAGCFDVLEACAVVEQALLHYQNGDILYPDKIVQIFNHASQDRINCLPATLLKEKICGMKWISVFPNNPVRFGIQTISAVILLSNTDNGYPVALLDATLCSNMRTAAVSTVAARYLAPERVETVGLIGAGEQAKMHCIFLKKCFPGIRCVRVSSKNDASVSKFMQEMRMVLPDLTLEPCGNDYEKAVTGSDILITATSTQSQMLQPEWIGRGTLYLHIGGLEDADGVALKADKIVCDNWAHAKHRTQTISRLYKAGKLTDGDIYGDLPDIVFGRLPGRERADEFIYFNTVGLSYVDIALGYAFYQKAANAGYGKSGLIEPPGTSYPDIKEFIK